jgi:hypothetical protein
MESHGAPIHNPTNPNGDTMENPELKLDLNLNEINMILATLGKHPFDEVNDLVGKIKTQGESQLQAAPVAEAQATNEEMLLG